MVLVPWRWGSHEIGIDCGICKGAAAVPGWYSPDRPICPAGLRPAPFSGKGTGPDGGCHACRTLFWKGWEQVHGKFQSGLQLFI